jgi:hypothetical protein
VITNGPGTPQVSASSTDLTPARLRLCLPVAERGAGDQGRGVATAGG